MWNQFLHSIEIEEVCKNWVLRLKKYLPVKKIFGTSLLEVSKNVFSRIAIFQPFSFSSFFHYLSILIIIVISHKLIPIRYLVSYLFHLFIVLLRGKFMNAYFWPPPPSVMLIFSNGNPETRRNKTSKVISKLNEGIYANPSKLRSLSLGFGDL